METYDMMGLGAKALAEGVPAHGVTVWVRRHKVASALLAEMGAGISPHPYLFVMGQDRTERMLLADLRAHGGDVAYGTSLVGLTQDDDGVRAELRRPDGTLDAVDAAWACGCDGAGSAVRHALGLGFAGGTYPRRFFVADVVADGPLGHGELGLCISEGGSLAVFPMLGAGHYRFIGAVPEAIAHRTDLGYEDVRAYAEAHAAMTVREALWFSTYNVHHRVADAFRRGRVFLAGDAGHIHSPVGGQGMNTGLLDAANLGWKLAAVIRGEADARILASYEAERMPFARQLVETTDRVFTFVSDASPLIGQVRAFLAPLAFAAATHLPLLRRELFGIVSQTRITYRDGPLAAGRVGLVAGGDRLPWVRWADGSSNYDALTALRPHFQVYGAVPAALEAFAAAHPAWPLVRLPDGPEVRRAGLEPGACYFVRPDGYLAYAAPTFDADAFRAHLATAWGIPS
jgi:2-polyprenyl-6-methoxyphenol hydroxylase-like FAD-dependent oxidoreductase